MEEDTLGSWDAGRRPEFGKAEGEFDEFLHEFDGLAAAAYGVVAQSYLGTIDGASDNDLRGGIDESRTTWRF